MRDSVIVCEAAIEGRAGEEKKKYNDRTTRVEAGRECEVRSAKFGGCMGGESAAEEEEIKTESRKRQLRSER